MEIENDFTVFKEWNNSLTALGEILEDLDKYPDPCFTPEKIERLCAPENIKKHFR